MDQARIRSVDEARRLAARVVPRVVFDYIDGGADDEVTMAANVDAMRRVGLRPRVAVGAVDPDLGATVLGTRLSLPVLLAPAGLVRLMHPGGAVAAARAAASAGTVSVLSAVAGTPVEEVAAQCDGPLWFQLYAPGGAEQLEDLVTRAHRARCAGLVITVDTAALGNRERDVRHGVAPPFHPGPAALARLGAQVAARPAWVAGMVRHELRARRAGSAGTAPERGPSARGVAMSASPVTWEEIGALRRQWDGPLVVKGVLRADDALRALAAGADGVVVSNHGGRQLDGAPATMDVLASVVDAVAGKGTVLLDGGVRRGGDVVKALAAGADAVLVGRAYLYGLAAAGEAGVARVIDVLRTEMRRTLQLLGCASVRDLDRGWVTLPG